MIDGIVLFNHQTTGLSISSEKLLEPWTNQSAKESFLRMNQPVQSHAEAAGDSAFVCR